MASQSHDGEIVDPRGNSPLILSSGRELPERIDYRQFGNPQQLQEFFDSLGVAELDGSKEFGDGFSLIEDKELLVKIPLLVVEMQFNHGDFGDYVAVRAFRRDNFEAIVFLDGSTGIRDQAAQMIENLTGQKYEIGRSYVQPFKLARGLRISEYDYTDDRGKTSRAKTFYFA